MRPGTGSCVIVLLAIFATFLLDCSTFPLCTMQIGHMAERNITGIVRKTTSVPITVIADVFTTIATFTPTASGVAVLPTLKTTTVPSTILTIMPPKSITTTSPTTSTPKIVGPPRLISKIQPANMSMKESLMKIPPMYMNSGGKLGTSLTYRPTFSTDNPTTTYRPFLTTMRPIIPTQLSPDVLFSPRPIPPPIDRISFEIMQYPHQQKLYSYHGRNYRFPIYGRYHGIWTEKVKPTEASSMKPDEEESELPLPGFDRTCKTYFDCGFRAAKNMTRTWLRCEDGYCSCKLLGYFKDEDTEWELRWSRRAEVCQADSGGPCGRNKGLEIHCKRGHKCIGNLCHRPSRGWTTTTSTPPPSSESCEDCNDPPIVENVTEKPANVFSLILFPGLNFFKNVLNESLSAVGMP